MALIGGMNAVRQGDTELVATMVVEAVRTQKIDQSLLLVGLQLVEHSGLDIDDEQLPVNHCLDRNIPMLPSCRVGPGPRSTSANDALRRPLAHEGYRERCGRVQAVSYEQCVAWWAALNPEERAAVLAIDGEVSHEFAAALHAANITPVPALLKADDGGYRSVWLMPATLRDFLEQRDPHYPFD